MRQFIEISGSCLGKMEVSIRQVYEVGGKLLVFAHLAKKNYNEIGGAVTDTIFRDQVVVDTDAKEKLPVTYILVDIDQDDVGSSAEEYLAQYQLRGVNRSGNFELSFIGKAYPLSAKAKLRYQKNPARTESFRIKDFPQFTSSEVSPYYVPDTELKNILNIYSTVQNGVYKVVLELITTGKQFTVMPRSLFPEAIFSGDDFNRIYNPTIEETIYFKATCGGQLRQYQTCALSLEVPGDDLTAVVELIEYLDAAWDTVFYKQRRFDLVQVSTASVLSCYQDPWFVCARVSEQDKRQYRQILNPPIALDKFLLNSLRFDFRESLRTMISQDIQTLANIPAYELLSQIFIMYADDIEYRHLLHCPLHVLCGLSEIDLGKLHNPATPFKEKTALIEQLELYLNKIENTCSRFLFRYLLNRFNRDFVKSHYCRDIASHEVLSEVKLHLDFLKQAVFELMPDGRMRISLAEHPVFLQHFAGRVKESTDFFKSFSWYLKMDFDKDSDYQSRLMLTQSSTKYLCASGFHIDDLYWDDSAAKMKHLASYPAADYRFFGASVQMRSSQAAALKQSDQRFC